MVKKLNDADLVKYRALVLAHTREVTETVRVHAVDLPALARALGVDLADPLVHKRVRKLAKHIALLEWGRDTTLSKVRITE